MVVVAGLFLLGQAAAIRAEGFAWQAAESARFDLIQSTESMIASPRPGEALARLRVDRLGLEVMVAEGSDEKTLALGPGHMQESALPGEPGNCIIAGHRDAEFRRLRDIRVGDVVDLSGWSGSARYRVTAIRIVDRDQTGLLAVGEEARLTLVTCYPFFYVGPAPQRFIVQAELVRAEVAQADLVQSERVLGR
jgi:sortase A